MSIATVLPLLLQKYNLNALELERMTGVPSSTIYRLLKGSAANPTVEVLKKISSFFQITISQLIGEEPMGCKQIPLIQPNKIWEFIAHPMKFYSDLKKVPVDFPLGNNCFATIAMDNLMEPFILINSMVIVDPDREICNKDFVLLISNEASLPKIRQTIFDGDDCYIRVLNSNCNIDIEKISFDDYVFCGSIVHYRTNLFDMDLYKFMADKDLHEEKMVLKK
ncbi:helix-turn-helix domain-containing protein [Legionella geestiana]|uniref:helix-turn-helix domain-containing protein n=1 Tax=Legionella geestiana TaxID=45065 RepID=UPI00068883A2|nr:helix-turn-helix domain-containing protein [Legionella geestiana]QBS13517.1 XRE family transcriptional regulator [Legionella geestiana]